MKIIVFLSNHELLKIRQYIYNVIEKIHPFNSEFCNLLLEFIYNLLQSSSTSEFSKKNLFHLLKVTASKSILLLPKFLLLCNHPWIGNNFFFIK